MAEWGPPAQSSRGASRVQAARHPDADFTKEAQLQTSAISLWTVVGAVQAMERTVEAHALRLLSLEQRSGTAEKRFAACEKALAELGSQLESRWTVLGTLLHEYGQLQRRLDNMENLLKNWNFWVLRVPADSSGEASKGSATLEEISSHFSHEKWESLQDWQKELYKNVVKGNCESLISLDFAISKLESLTCTGGELPCGLPQADSRGAQEPPANTGTEPPAARTEVISWIKQEDDLCGREQGRLQGGSTCNYYTVSRSDSLPNNRGEGPACIPFQTDVEPEVDAIAVLEKPDCPNSRTDLISWMKEKKRQSGQEGGDGPQSTSDNRGLLSVEDHQTEDPANPPLLLFFPGGSVAPIYNGTIGESQPLSSLHGNCVGSRASQNDPSSPAVASEAAMDRPHTCLECGKTFSLLLSLQIHQMNHQKKKRYECAYCGFAFGCPSELIRHEMIHTKERPYKCTVCGKGFVRKQHLIPHLRLHTGERPYHCAECGKNFICKHHLLEHQRTHTGERPYACVDCGKTFRRKKSLKDHLHIHVPEQGLTDSTRGLPDDPGNVTDLRAESTR